jgi:hypothetical protein
LLDCAADPGGERVPPGDRRQVKVGDGHRGGEHVLLAGDDDPPADLAEAGADVSRNAPAAASAMCVAGLFMAEDLLLLFLFGTTGRRFRIEQSKRCATSTIHMRLSDLAQTQI